MNLQESNIVASPQALKVRATVERKRRAGLLKPAKYRCQTCGYESGDGFYHRRINPGHVVLNIKSGNQIGLRVGKRNKVISKRRIISVLGNEKLNLLERLLHTFTKEELIAEILKGEK